MKKQILAILLVATLMMGLAVPVAADNISQIIGDGNTVIFVDVPASYWAANEIKYFASQGIINGKPDGTFAPTEGVTREAFAKMLVLTFRAPLTTPEAPTFVDVAADRWSYAYIEVAKDFLTGYVSPFDGSMSYHPDEEATREDIAVALVRMLGLTGADAKNPNYARSVFDDSSEITPSLLPYVSLAVERGLITGFEDYSYGYRRMLFAPQKSISRAETVVMLNRASKQAVVDGTSDLELTATTVYDAKGDNVTLYIAAPEGSQVTVDGVAVKMELVGSTARGAFNYHFDAEGAKVFTVTATKLGKTKTIQVNAQYQIGGPKLTITQCPTNVTEKTVTIAGTLTDSNYGVSLTINGASVPVSSWKGEWSKSYTLEEGANTFTIEGKNEAGKTVSETRTINFSVGGPKLTITQCPTDVTEKTITIAGTLTDGNYGVSLTINGASVPVSSWKGEWSKSYTLEEGANTFTIVGKNEVGKMVTETRTINFSVGGPKLTITQCPTDVTEKTITIAGTLTDGNYGVSLTINGASVPVSSWKGEWSKSYTLEEGANTFTIVGKNEAGKTVTETRTINFSVGGPKLTITQCPTDVTEKTITIAGTLTDSNYGVTLTINGASVPVSSWKGEWSKSCDLAEGENTFTIVGKNEVGKTVTETCTVNLTIAPPTFYFYNCPETTTSRTVSLVGRVTDDYTPVRLFLNDQALNVDYRGDFTKEVSLTPGDNVFTFRAVNAMGKETVETKTVVYQVEEAETVEDDTENVQFP